MEKPNSQEKERKITVRKITPEEFKQKTSSNKLALKNNLNSEKIEQKEGTLIDLNFEQ